MIEKILNEIHSFLSGTHHMEPLEFSLYLEDYLCDNYDVMYKEDANMTVALNEEIPDICAEVERDTDGLEFKKKLKNELINILD